MAHATSEVALEDVTVGVPQGASAFAFTFDKLAFVHITVELCHHAEAVRQTAHRRVIVGDDGAHVLAAVSK